MKNKNAAYGALFILLATYLVINKLGMIPHIPVIKIVITCILAYVAIKGIMKMEFFQIFMPLAFIGWQYDNLLGIEKLTPWTLIGTAILLSIGFELLFPNKKGRLKKWSYQKNHPNLNFEFNSDGIGSGSNGSSNFQSVMKEDGEYFNVENAFGDTARYIDSEHFRFAGIDNGFGKCLVYFNNCKVLDEATIEIDNGMGKTEIYIPGNWRIELHTDNGLGNINLNGTPSQNLSDPLVRLNIDNGLGTVDVTVVS